jgi:HAD superfamily hydrolase (TIGR01509 family)
MWDRGLETLFERRDMKYNKNKVKHVIGGKSLMEIANIMREKYDFREEPKEIELEILETMKNIFSDNIGYIPGFKDFYLTQVKGSKKSAIATAMHEQLMNIANTKTDIINLFDRNVYTIAQVGNVGKPDPAIFNYAANRIGADPKKTVCIEDSPNGIKAIKRAGMFAIAITTTYDKEKLMEADMIVDSYKEIDILHS